MEEELQAVLDAEGYEDWEVADDSVLICPHGDTIEWDGQCSEGCVSPLMGLGLI